MSPASTLFNLFVFVLVFARSSEGSTLDGEILCNWTSDNTGFPVSWDCERINPDPCSGGVVNSSWEGITCNVNTERVSSITLQNLVIEGAGFGPEIAGLEVTSWTVSSSRLDGFIPEAIGQILTLISLNFSNNNLYGSIPATLWTLPSLQVIDLSYNELTGDIADIGYLTSPTTIILRKNMLNGTIPNTLYPSLSTVNTLDLSYNQFYGNIPSSLGQLSIQNLYLQNNSLSGNIPSSFSLLQEIQNINLANNELVGCFPNSSMWTSLQTCDASGNSGIYCNSICSFPTNTGGVLCDVTPCTTTINPCTDGTNQCNGFTCNFVSSNNYTCSCPSNYFGLSSCSPCTCQNGVCKNGSSGDGTCLSCKGSYYGVNCNNDCVTSCGNGVCYGGIEGNGSCLSCNSGFFGPTCSPCVCSPNGICNEGISGDGYCVSCNGTGYYGNQCSLCPCVNGVCNGTVSGNGACISCSSGFSGVFCDIVTSNSTVVAPNWLYDTPTGIPNFAWIIIAVGIVIVLVVVGIVIHQFCLKQEKKFF